MNGYQNTDYMAEDMPENADLVQKLFMQVKKEVDTISLFFWRLVQNADQVIEYADSQGKSKKVHDCVSCRIHRKGRLEKFVGKPPPLPMNR